MSASSSATMTFTSSRETSSTSLRRCPPSAAWPGTSASNSTIRRWRTQRRNSSPTTSVTPPAEEWLPVHGCRASAPTVGWRKLRSQNSRGQPHLQKSLSQLLHSPPNLPICSHPTIASTQGLVPPKSPPCWSPWTRLHGSINDISAPTRTNLEGFWVNSSLFYLKTLQSIGQRRSFVTSVWKHSSWSSSHKWAEGTKINAPLPVLVEDGSLEQLPLPTLAE